MQISDQIAAKVYRLINSFTMELSAIGGGSAELQHDRDGQLVVHLGLYAGPNVTLHTERVDDECAKCGSSLKDGFCTDNSCPYHDWTQIVSLEDLQNLTDTDVIKVYGPVKRLDGG